jgi:hypothetical protein
MVPMLACTAFLLAGCANAAHGAPHATLPVPGAHPVGTTPAPLSAPPAPSSIPPSPSAPPPPPVVPPPLPPGCRADSEWSCTQQQRFLAAGDYIGSHVAGHGYLGVVFTDRRTGAAWHFGSTRHEGWTASTIKLAIAMDLLHRASTGQVTLSTADRRDMASMLNFSDEAASDRLWSKYGGDDMLARFRDQFGMSGLHFVPGYTSRTYWGFVKCTPDDLAALMTYIFTEADAGQRGYLVDALRGVAGNQRWGVWAAGPDQQPGNKDGWSYEADSYGRHWVTNTVGFAGPQERYQVAVMYQVDPSGSLADGVHTVSDVVALLFGAPVPAQIEVPEPDG